MRRLRATTAGLPPAYWYLWYGTLLNRIGGFVVPFLALYMTQDQGLPLRQAAFVVSLYGAGAFAANLAGGVMADVLGRRTTMVVGLTSAAAAMLLLGFASSYALMAGATLVLGFCTDLYRPAASAAIADVVAPQDRVRAYGLMYWAINLGAALAPLIAGFIATRAFLALFVLDAVTTLGYAVLILLRVPETRPAGDGTDPRPGGRLLVAFRDGPLVALAGLGLLVACFFFQYHVTLPIDMMAHGLTAQDYGLAISVNGALIVLLSIPVSHWVARFRRLRVLAVGAVFVGLGFGLTGLVETLPFYALSVMVWTFGELMMAPVTPTLAADLAPPHLRGLYQGVLGASWGLAALVGPAVGGYVYEQAGASVLWGACAVGGVLAAVGYLVLTRSVHRRLEPA